MSPYSKNKYVIARIAAQGLGRILVSNPGKVCGPRSFPETFTAELFHFCFLPVLWMCHNDWLFNRLNVNTDFQTPEKMLLKITNSRKLQIWTLFFNFGKIKGFSGELISHSDGWFYIQCVCSSCLVEHEVSSQGDQLSRISSHYL